MQSSLLALYVSISIVAMLAVIHAAERYGMRRNAARGLAIALCVIIWITYATGADTAASSLLDVIVNSPSGTFTSPRGIIRLCREIQATADGQVVQTTVFLMVVYLVLQTFCIPGTIALNAVCGALLGMQIGVPLCVAAGTAGASCCYLLSSVTGARLAEIADKRFMQGKGVGRLRSQVTRYREDLFAFLLFLRLTPILPNWLINLASPIVHVPLSLFALATFVGITPQTYLSVRFGTLIHVTSLKSVISMYDTILIALVGCAVIAVGKLRKRFVILPGGSEA